MKGEIGQKSTGTQRQRQSSVHAKPKAKLPKARQKEVVAELETKSFAEEIENDAAKAAIYINRADQAAAALGEDHPVVQQERASLGVYKRALLLAGSGDMELHNRGKDKSAAENGLPVSSYLSHGARVMVEIPPGSGDQLINWLTSGDKGISGVSRKQSQQGAIDEGKIVYNRSAATHDVAIRAGADGQYTVREKKGFFIGARDFFKNKFLRRETKHFGVDLAMNAEFGKQDSQGVFVDKPDGDHGHLYFHYTPPTQNKPGSLLMGIEGGSPSSSKHSKTGASDPLSPVDSSKWDDLAKKKRIAGEKEYKDTVVPQKYNGMTVKLDTPKLSAITGMDEKEYGAELAYMMPARDPSKFGAQLHETTKFTKSEEVSTKPSRAKRFANKAVKLVTFGRIKPFQKEIKAYKADQKVAQNDSAREQKQQLLQSAPIEPIATLDADEKKALLKRMADAKQPGITKRVVHTVTSGRAFKKEMEGHKKAIQEAQTLSATEKVAKSRQTSKQGRHK